MRLTLGMTGARRIAYRSAAATLLISIQLMSASPSHASDEALMERSGCISCHRVDQKLLGPAFRDVAARYRGDPQAAAKLFVKVREGGEGEWGDIPMQPNGEEKISDADLRTVIQWLLSLAG